MSTTKKKPQEVPVSDNPLVRKKGRKYNREEIYTGYMESETMSVKQYMEENHGAYNGEIARNTTGRQEAKKKIGVIQLQIHMDNMDRGNKSMKKYIAKRLTSAHVAFVSRSIGWLESGVVKKTEKQKDGEVRKDVTVDKPIEPLEQIMMHKHIVEVMKIFPDLVQEEADEDMELRALMIKKRKEREARENGTVKTTPKKALRDTEESRDD